MLKSALLFDKNKYLTLAETDGLSAAITQLQHDTIKWEHMAFEGEEGFLPHLWQDLHAVRDFARELWDRSLAEGDPQRKSNKDHK